MQLKREFYFQTKYTEAGYLSKENLEFVYLCSQCNQYTTYNRQQKDQQKEIWVCSKCQSRLIIQKIEADQSSYNSNHSKVDEIQRNLDVLLQKFLSNSDKNSAIGIALLNRNQVVASRVPKDIDLAIFGDFYMKLEELDSVERNRTMNAHLDYYILKYQSINPLFYIGMVLADPVWILTIAEKFSKLGLLLVDVEQLIVKLRDLLLNVY